MKAALCTIDSSCVIALDHLGLLGGLTHRFSRVLVPKAVRVELYKRRETKDRIRRLLRDFHFIERCNFGRSGRPRSMLAGRAGRYRGEAEAIMQASQRRATVLMDDRWGREKAALHQLDCHGTLWVLERLNALGLVAGDDLRRHLISLRERAFRLPLREVNSLLRRAGQPALEPSLRRSTS